MATISEAEILKAAAEASLISAGNVETVTVPMNQSNLATLQVVTAPSLGNMAQSRTDTAMATHGIMEASTSHDIGGDNDYSNVPTVSENAVIRSGFEVGGKTYDNVEAILAAHLMGVEEAGTSMKADHSSNIDFDEEYNEMGEEVTYKILRGATKRGNDKLLDSLGFSYTLKNTKGMSGVSYWWCSVRNSHCRCPAIVKQIGRTFTRGKWKHEHLVGLNKSANYSPAKAKKKQIREKKKQKRKLKEENRAPDYVIIKEGSKAGMDLLKDKFGYTYTMRKANKTSDKCNWICSIRNKHLRCPASVVQEGNSFKAGINDHKHLPGEKTEKPAEVVSAYNEAFLRNTQGSGNYSESDEDYDDDYDDDDDDESDHFDYGDTTPGTVVRTSKNRKQERKEHPTFLGPTCTINLTKCEAPGCNCKLVHCPFCDKDHFKPAKPARVQDHLEMSHFAHGVQFDDYMIVKCFKDCGMKKFGHYHCVFCKEQIIKRTAYGRHLSRHMKRKGIPTNQLILPDSKFPDTINAYGYEIPMCKNDCKTSEGKHFHCPKCKRVCRERSVTVNHVWRCLQESQTEDDMVDVNDAEEYGLEESLLKHHFSIVKNFKDLSQERCEEPNCCRNMFHCQLCPPNLYRPTYKQQLLVHYISHWKTRVPYKGYNVMRCFHACLDPRLPPIKTRYHYHCPLCAKMLRQRNTFQDHLSYCHYFNTGESVTLDSSTDRTDDVVRITKELAPLIENVDYMEDKLTMEAKLNQSIQIESSFSPGIVQRNLRSMAIKQDSDVEADNSMDEDEVYDNGSNRNDQKRPAATPVIHQEFLKHLTSRKSDVTFEDVTEEIQGAAKKGRKNLKRRSDTNDLDFSMIYETSSAILSENLVKSFKKESSLKACLSIVTQRTDTKLIQSDIEGQKTYMLTGSLDNLGLAQQLIAQLVLPTEKANTASTSFSKRSKTLEDRAVQIKKEIQDSSDDDENRPLEVDERQTLRKRPESYKEKMARIRKEKEMSKKSETGKNKQKGVAEEKKKSKGRTRKDVSDSEEMNDSFPYSEIKEIIAASKNVDKKRSASKSRKGNESQKVETPVKTSSRGRPLTQRHETPSSRTRSGKSNAESPSVKTPKVSVKKSNKAETPSRYGTRGIKIDYQKMNAGQVYIKEEVISDGEEAHIVSDEEDSQSESENENDTPVKEKGGRPVKGGVTSKRASVMYKPVTDSELSESDKDGDKDESQEADESISDNPDETLSDKSGDEPGNDKTIKKSDPGLTKLEKTTNSDGTKGKFDLEKTENEPKVTIQVISRASPIKIGSTALSPVKQLPTVITKTIIPTSPKKESAISNEALNKESPTSEKKDVKTVASVPAIYSSRSRQTRKTMIIYRKRKTDKDTERGRSKRLKITDSDGETIEINENIDNELDGHWDEQKSNISLLAKDRLKCSLCSFEAEIFSGLTDHLQNYHNVADPPRCDVCELDFATSKHLQVHVDKKHGPQQQPQKFKCGACESVFTSQKMCQIHISRVHLGKEDEKLQQRKGPKYACKKCEFFSTAAQDFYDHMKIKHGEDIVCDVCEKTFSNLANLKLHKETVHLKNKTAACYVCGKHFNHIRYLKVHMESHSQTHKFSCAECERRFSSKATLVAHLETHKPPEERDYKFICNFCGKRYLLKSNYEDHLNKHTGAKPYSCKLCNKSFGFRSMLVKHNIYIHSNNRPYSCSLCPKAFKFQRLLDNHMTTHTMLSNHVCSKCLKSFTTKNSLKVHEQKCTGLLAKQPATAVGKANTLILYADGRPSLYQFGSEQFTTSTTDGVSTIISIPDQPTVQEQIFTEVLNDQKTEVIPQQTTEVLVPSLVPQPVDVSQTIGEPSQVPGENAETVMEQNSQTVSGQDVNVLGQEVNVSGQEANVSGQVYVCSECNSFFSSFLEAETHISSVHSQQVVS